MNVMRKYKLVIVIILASFSLTSCAVRREADNIIFSTAMEEDVQENSEIYRIKQKEIELGEILEIFLGMTAEEAEEY